jgi:hypothetical protein
MRCRNQGCRPIKICSYVIKTDSGLAPNPFWGYCSLALCTPNHQRARLFRGDWIAGNSSASDGHRLVYAMRIDEVLDFDSYSRDPRFKQKQPIPQGTIEEQAGDNFYYLENGTWRRLPSRFHNDEAFFYKDLGRDLSGRPVFVGQHFIYFGDKRVSFPKRLCEIVRRNQGIQYTKGMLAEQFVVWLERNHKPGVIGKPLNRSDRSHENGEMLTGHSRRKAILSIKCGRTPKAIPAKSCS